MIEIIINGDWDGKPIWRRKTTGEFLAEMLYKKQLEADFEQHDCHTSPEDGCQACEVYMEAKRLEANEIN